MGDTNSAAIDVLAGLSTSGVSDALDRLGIAGQCFRVMPILAGMRLCGPAFTLRYQPIGMAGGTVGDFIDDVPPGAVVAPGPLSPRQGEGSPGSPSTRRTGPGS